MERYNCCFSTHLTSSILISLCQSSTQSKSQSPHYAYTICPITFPLWPYSNHPHLCLPTPHPLSSSHAVFIAPAWTYQECSHFKISVTVVQSAWNSSFPLHCRIHSLASFWSLLKCLLEKSSLTTYFKLQSTICPVLDLHTLLYFSSQHIWLGDTMPTYQFISPTVHLHWSHKLHESRGFVLFTAVSPAPGMMPDNVDTW